MNIIGIDPASNRLSYTLLQEDGGFTTSDHKLGDKYSSACCVKAMHIAEELMYFPAEDTTVFIEAPVVGRGGVRPTMVQSFVSGAIQGVLAERYDLYLVNVQTWKKAIVGKGNAKKEEVGPAVMSKITNEWPGLWPQIKDSQDMQDATAVALYGRMVVKGAERFDGLK